MTCFEAITNAIKPETRHDIAQSLYPRWKNIISPTTTALLTTTSTATALSTIAPPTTTPSTIPPPTTTLATAAPLTTARTACTALAANPSDHASKPLKKRRKLGKCKADLAITIDPLILDNLDTWARSPQEFFDQKHIEAKKECLWTYILALNGLSVFNTVRLRFVKWKLYRHWIKWKDDGGTVATFLQHLKDRGVSLDRKDFEKWMLEGFTYDVFVLKLEEGSLIATDMTATQSVFLANYIINIANNDC
jgi:hypothetical protein